MKKNILITGGAGYIGSMLITNLLEIGHKVTLIDNLAYPKDAINHLFVNKNFIFIKDDACKDRVIKKNILKKDYIIPLAALVGAPLCEKNKQKAIKTNVGSIKTILKYKKRSQKIIYLTTNSGYGIGEKNKYCDENSELRPVSLYGKTKNLSEELVRKKDNHICFRLATVFGYSYRMRTDLIVNNFVLTAMNKKKLVIFEPHFRRNFIHIKDVVRAVIFSIKNFNKMKNNVYNLGLSNANITKINLAKKIKKNLKYLKIEIKHNMKDPDQRDYFVSNKKIEKKGFKAIYNLDDGIHELIKVYTDNNKKYLNNY